MVFLRQDLVLLCLKWRRLQSQSRLSTKLTSNWKEKNWEKQLIKRQHSDFKYEAVLLKISNKMTYEPCELNSNLKYWITFVEIKLKMNASFEFQILLQFFMMTPSHTLL